MSSNQDKQENILHFLVENLGVSNKTIFKELSKVLQFVVQSCFTKNYVLKNFV